MIKESKIGKYDTALTIVAIVVIGFYATGFYKNILEIKQLKENGKKSS